VRANVITHLRNTARLLTEGVRPESSTYAVAPRSSHALGAFKPQQVAGAILARRTEKRRLLQRITDACGVEGGAPRSTSTA